MLHLHSQRDSQAGPSRWDELRESVSLLIELACCFDRRVAKTMGGLELSWRGVDDLLRGYNSFE